MSIATKNPRAATLDAIVQAANIAREPNWDGQGAEAVAPLTREIAKAMIAAMPEGLAAPSVHAEPDGHLCLEWYRDVRTVLSVSVAPNRELHWAALYGDERFSGVALFGAEFPGELLAMAERVIR